MGANFLPIAIAAAAICVERSKVLKEKFS